MAGTIASESQVSTIIAAGFIEIKFSMSFAWMAGSSCASVATISIPYFAAASFTPCCTDTKKGLVCVFMESPIITPSFLSADSAASVAFSSTFVSAAFVVSVLAPVLQPTNANTESIATVAINLFFIFFPPIFLLREKSNKSLPLIFTYV